MTDIAAKIAATAARIREGGMPDFLNRWATMTPDQYVANEDRRALIIAALHKGDYAMNSAKIGPREQALRDMRAEDTPLNLPKTKASASAVAKKAIVAATQESNLKTAESTPSDATTVKGHDPSPEFAEMAGAAVGRTPENTPKAKAPAKVKTQKESTVKTKPKAKAPAKKGAAKSKTERRKSAKAKASRNSARAATESGVRPGSKLEAIVGLLQRDGGCTTADILAKTGWPSVSVPQQAKAAGLKLKKEKVDGVTRYSAA